jgi:hypothetical protein
MTDREEAQMHEQARLLAAESIDVQLVPEESAWLEDHLAACDDCRAVAAEYTAIHAELSTLAMPEPPRDLWARTRAALDQADGGSGRPMGRRSPAGLGSLLGTSMAVGAVVVIAGAALLSQTPIVRQAPPNGSFGPIANASASGLPGGGAQQPLAVMNGTTYWISGSDGVYEIKGGSSACDPADATCTVSNGGGQTLGTISSDSTVSAAIAPGATVAAVWTDDKVAILPLDNTSPSVALDLLTPQPTIAQTIAPTPSPTPVRTPSPTPTASPIPTPIQTAAATESMPATLLPSVAPSAAATLTAAATATATASALPSIAEATPTPAPATATPAPATATPASTGGAFAILSGYQIVGSGPAFSADGKTVAFSARPSDQSAGPDVFVWQAGDLQAHAITQAHSDFFSGWFGSSILVSEIDAGGSAAAGTVVPMSYLFDPSTDRGMQITRPMYLPVVDPTGRFVVYWSGSVEFDPATGMWQPGAGDLYFDKWSNLDLVAPGTPLPSATPPSSTTSPEVSPAPTLVVSAPPSVAPIDTPSATASAAPALDLASPSPTAVESPFGSATPEPSVSASPPATPTPTPAPPALPQLLPVAQGAGSVDLWQVRWDAAGLHLAIWVADKSSTTVGGLELFSVDRATGLVDTDQPLLAAQKVMSNIQFDSAHLVYTLATDGKTYLQAVPEQQPTVSTAAPSVPAPSAGAPTVPSTDRPGN